MHFTLAISVLTLAGLAITVPQLTRQRNGTAIPIVKRSRLMNADESVDFDALKAHAASVSAKIRRGFANFERNTGSKHPFAAKGVEERGIGDLLGDDNNMLWYGILAVGTPPFFFNVVFDTGSGDLIVPSTKCDSTCSGHTLYDPTSSSTANDQDWLFTLGYGGGTTVSCEEYTDTVAIDVYTATSQTLGAATHYSSVLQSPQFPADGLMGMAFQQISAFGASPVFQTLISEGQVTNPAFSFKFSSPQGEIYVEGSNSELYTGDFSYAPVTEQGFWQVNLDSLQVNGQTILNNAAAIIDTGTSFLVGPPADVSTLYNALDGIPAPQDGYYLLSCDSFPNISLTFGGTSFPIPTSALNLGPAWPGSSECVGGIVGQEVGSSLWVIGDVFLQSVYTTFDVGNSRVGFARLA